MRRKRYLIVGGSAAGMAAAQAIRTLDPDGRVCVLSEESDPPYFRPLIPYIVSREKEVAQILLQGQGPFQARGIEVRLATRARYVDPERQTVVVADELFHYDRLLIATGGQPIMPKNTEGMDAEGVMSLRTLADAKQMADRARHARSAVVLGAGLWGIKAAMALLRRGLAVTLVEKEAEILPWLMESDAGGRIRRVLEDAGVAVMAGSTIKAVQADHQGACGVVLENGRELACRLVCVGIGVKPNTACLEKSGIRVDAGIVTDTYTACSTPNVFAAGDVAMAIDPIANKPIVTGLWTNAVEMGRCAGANMAGRPTTYSGAFGILNATQVAQMPFVAMGVVHTAGTDFEVIHHKSSDTYRKLIFTPEGDHLLGVLFIGDVANAGLYRAVIHSKRRIGKIKQHLVNHTLHYGHLLLDRE